MSPFIRPASVRPADRTVARSVFYILLAFYTATFVGIPDVHDSEVEFQTIRSLVNEGTFALGDTPEAEAILAASRSGHAGFNVHRGGPGREDRFYSWFGVGQAFVGIPFYVAGNLVGRIFPDFEERHRERTHYVTPRSEYFEHLAVGWRNAILTALTASLLVLSTRRLGARRKHAWIAGLAYGLCSFAWPQARSTLSDVQATFFLFAAFHLLLRLREDFKRFKEPRRLNMVLTGLALGGAFLTRVVTAPAILVLVLAALTLLIAGRRRTREMNQLWRDFAALYGPALACVGVFLWTNYARFGDAMETGYGDVVFSGGFFTYPWYVGTARLLISPSKGLLFLAPAVLLFPIWWSNLLRERDRFLFWVTIAFIAAVFAPVATTQTWHGAWTYGPRYVLPALPILWLGVAPTMHLWSERPILRLLAPSLFVFGLVTNLPGVFVDHITHQELALEAAREIWPDTPGTTEEERDDHRFLYMQSDWRLAAPWAHWRILRHRVAGMGEEFPLRQIFLIDSERKASPAHVRNQGFRHFAWVDFHERLGGPLWPATLLILSGLGLGLALAIQGLDPNAR